MSNYDDNNDITTEDVDLSTISTFIIVSLEMLIVRLVNKHPEDYEYILSHCRIGRY